MMFMAILNGRTLLIKAVSLKKNSRLNELNKEAIKAAKVIEKLVWGTFNTEQDNRMPLSLGTKEKTCLLFTLISQEKIAQST